MPQHLKQKRPLHLFLIIVGGLLLLLISCQEGTAPETVRPTRRPFQTRTAVSSNGDQTAEDDETSTPQATGSAAAEVTEEATIAGPPASPTPRPSRTPTAADTAVTPFATPATVESPTGAEGALIQLTLNSSAGLLLDELPIEMRARVRDSLAEESAEFWQTLAREQVRLTYNRLHFRPFFYDQLRGQLPFPPEALWEITLKGEPYQATIEGHTLMLHDYEFSSTLLTDMTSPAAAEPALAEIDGRWQEPFILPLDPTLLLQRTSNACINEGGFPPNSFDSENVFLFFDYSCTADSSGAAGCHRTQRPSQSCLEALTDRVGTIQTTMNFERLAWDEDLADEVRVGQVLNESAPNLIVVGDDLSTNRIVYRYFPPNSCALQEACVNGDGWRRLLMFDSTVHNLGAEPLYIGRVITQNPLNSLFQYNACHDHNHFANFGEFQLGAGQQPSKQAFCVESTSRFSNNELSPLTHDYTCNNQGIQAGWVDEYQAGLDCQWIDITNLEFDGEPVTLPLTFRFNQDAFLCEGTPVLNEAGELQWEPTGERNAEGLPLNRPQCEFVEDWQVNNEGTQEVVIPPTGSFVTEPCALGELGPLRNCGFLPQQMPPLPTPPPPESEEEEPEPVYRCQPGEIIQMSCSVPEAAQPQVLRICETSAALGTGTACTFETALQTRTITSDGRDLAFTCPLPRSEDEPGGDYAFYIAPIYPADELVEVSCEVTD